MISLSNNCLTIANLKLALKKVFDHLILPRSFFFGIIKCILENLEFSLKKIRKIITNFISVGLIFDSGIPLPNFLINFATFLYLYLFLAHA